MPNCSTFATVLRCERPAGLLPSTARDGREDVIARAAAASCALGTSDRLAFGGPVRGFRTACARRPDRREARAGTERAGAAAATRCRRAEGEQPLPGGEPKAADCRAPASDQPPGARRRPRQSRSGQAHAREAARRHLHVGGPAVLARGAPRRQEPRRPDLTHRDGQLDLEAGRDARPPGGLVPAPGRPPADDAAQRTHPAAPAGGGARSGAQPDRGAARLRAASVQLRPLPDRADDLRPASGPAGRRP